MPVPRDSILPPSLPAWKRRSSCWRASIKASIGGKKPENASYLLLLREHDAGRNVSPGTAKNSRSSLMKRFAIPAISLAALMASGIAFAQTTPDQQPSTKPAQEMQQKAPETKAP